MAPAGDGVGAFAGDTGAGERGWIIGDGAAIAPIRSPRSTEKQMAGVGGPGGGAAQFVPVYSSSYRVTHAISSAAGQCALGR